MKKDELFKDLYKLKPDDRILLITHSDLDGSGPVVILNKYFKHVDVQHCTNAVMSYSIREAVLETLNEGEYDVVVACDLSVEEADAKLIDASPNKEKFVLIDHHLTAEWLNKYAWASVESNLLEDSYRAQAYEGLPENLNRSSSGTSLLYNYLIYIGIITDRDPDLDMFVHIVACYDTWDWMNTFTDADICYDLNLLYNVYGSEVFDREFSARFTTMDVAAIENFNKQNKLLLEIEENKRDNFLKYVDRHFQTGKITIQDKEYSVCLWVGNSYLNDVFMKMKEHWPNRDLYIICYGTGISVRKTDDNENINVGEIVKMFKGGGHNAAGGFKIPTGLQMGYIQAAFEGCTLNIDY